MDVSTKKNTNIFQKSLSAAKYTVLYKILTQAVSLIVMVFLVRVLSEHDYGVYNLLYSLIAFIGVVASFGIANTLQRFIPEYYAKKEFGIANRLYRLSSAVRLISNVILLSVIFLFWENISPILKIAEYKPFFLLFSVVIILHMQRELLEICLGAYFLQKYSQGATLVFTLIKCAGYSFAIVLNTGLWEILITDLLAYLVAFILLETIFVCKIPVKKTKMPTAYKKAEKKRLVRYALFYNFNDTGVGLLQADFDNFILVGFLDPVAVGAYSFCQRITKTIQRVSPVTYLQDVIRPAFFSMATSDDAVDINKFFNTSLKVNLMFHIPVFLFIVIFGEEIIHVIFNGKFISYTHVLAGVYFFGMLNSFFSPVGMVAQLRERADIILYSKIFAVYNLAADVIFIKYFGISGAVVATGTAVLCKNIFIWYFVRKDAFICIPGIFWIRFFIFWSTSAAAVWLVTNAMTTPLIVFAVGAMLFGLLSMAQFQADLFDQGEKKLFAKTVKNKTVLKIFRCRE